MTEDQQKVRGVADIVFLIDATGSMQPCIDALKRNIETFIDSLTVKGGNNISPVRDWRAKVVGFRDFEVDADPYRDNPFVSDSVALKAQLSTLEARGGGDEPESLLDAVYRLATMGQTEKGAQEADPVRWRYRSSAARVVIVFTDAPYKETMALPEAKGGGAADVANAVVSNRIILSLFAPEMACYDSLSEIDKAEYTAIPVGAAGPQEALRTFVADQSNFRETLKQLAASVSKSAETPSL